MMMMVVMLLLLLDLSVTDVAVVGGQEYLIEWDDRWGADAFDWELTFTPAPAPVVELPITFEDGQLPVLQRFQRICYASNCKSRCIRC